MYLAIVTSNPVSYSDLAEGSISENILSIILKVFGVIIYSYIIGTIMTMLSPRRIDKDSKFPKSLNSNPKLTKGTTYRRNNQGNSNTFQTSNYTRFIRLVRSSDPGV